MIDCGTTKLNNLCMKEASICPGTQPISDPAAPSRRKKRENECDSSSSESKSNCVDPDNPLEMIFHPTKKGEEYDLMAEAKKEYENNFEGMDMVSSYDALFEILWYTQIPCFDVYNVTSIRQHENGMIKSCMWKGVRMPCSKLFTAFPTDRGMCCSFNVEAAEKMFTSGVYRKMINKMQKRDKDMAFDTLESWSNVEYDYTESTPEAGVSKGLTLMLDSHSDLLSGSSVSDDFQGFLAIVNDKKQFPITTQKSVLIRPGQYNLVSIQATKVSAKRDIRKYPARKRKCYFEDEMPLIAHNNYSYSNCKLECMMDKVFTSLKDDDKKICIPWFFPPIQAGYPMCDPWESQDFRKRMSNISDSQCTKCRPDCENVEIRASASAAPFRRCDYKNVDMTPLCMLETDKTKIPYPPKWGQSVLEEYKATGEIPEYVMSTVITNKRSYVMEKDKKREGQRGKELFSASNNEDANYDAYEKDIATVTFFFESSNSFEFIRQSKTTLIDYISQVGGLLGVCLGFSFISAVEIVYWITIKLFRNLSW